MTIERSLQIAVAIMASLGTILLGMGARNALLPLVTIVVAVSSLYLTDKLGWIRLNRNVASLAAVAAVCISVIDFFQLGSENQLLAIAYLLIYLQIVLMYQRKDVRVYWQLLMLSLLQVVVASALNFGLGFGTLLIVYMFVGLLALALFFAYREFGQPPSPQLDAGQTGRAGRRSSSAASGALTAANVVLDGTTGADDELLWRGIRRRTLQTGGVTLLCTFTLFFLLPRFGEDSPLRQIAGQRMVGFNDTVELGRLGKVIESSNGVMRVWFEDTKSGQPYKVFGAPFFRGAVLNHYDLAKRSWSFKPPSGTAPDLADLSIDPTDSKSIAVREIVSLEPAHESTVCSVYPCYSLAANDRILYNEHNQQIIRRVSPRAKLDLSLLTTGIHRGLQDKIVPLNTKFDPFFFNREGKPVSHRMRASLAQLTQFPDGAGGRQPFPRLVETAASVLEQANLPAEDVIGRAQALESHFRDSGLYAYQLNPVSRNLTVDPIEDFVAENRKGHCEYFASALTLMLRSQGIPARMVVGFKGGEWNSLGGYYQVRQLHAHAWVEALIADYQGTGLRRTSRDAAVGAWLRLDPTPSIDTFEETAEDLTLTERFNEWVNYVEFLWSNYVVELDAKRQREAIYDSLATAGRYARRAATPQFWLSDVPAAVASLDDVNDPVQVANRWLSWRAGMLTIAMLLVVVVAYRRRKPLAWLAKYLADRLAKRKNVAAAAARRAPVVEFYRRLEAILRRHGIERPTGQTQHEFAVAVGGQLVENRRWAAAAAIPRQIVDMFYRVRFGGQTISPRQQEEIDRALHRLSEALKETE